MTTAQKLWLGFGTLTALLVVVCVAVLVRVRSIEGQVNQMTTARDRDVAARELEGHVVGYTLAVRTFLQTDDARFRHEAAGETAGVGRHLADYRRHATTARQQQFAADFAALWEKVHGQGQHVMTPESRPLKRAGTERLTELRLALDRLVDDEMQAEAVEHYDARREATERDARAVGGFVLVLLLVGSLVAVATSGVVGRAVVRGERVVREQGEALSQADRRKDEFLAMLAHELRNLLAPLRSGLQVVKLARDDRDAVERSRSMMERQLGQMARLIDDLLDVSRISRGKVEIKRERVELAAVVQSSVETARPLIEQSGHELTVGVPPDPIHVDADATRLAQVFANLLTNAAKYTERGGTIRLTVVRQGGDAVVSVRDNGVGIPAHMLPKVFDLFTQVDLSRDRSQGGLGIGLTLVKRLVEMHGGSVEVRSDGHGTGSEFVVRLPVDSSVAHDAESPTDANAATGPPPRRRILVVDDNRDAAGSLATLLDLMGNETRTAHDGLEAVDVAAAFRPDVILMDIGMPGLNGYDAARRLRERPSGKSVVLVACTGWGQDDDKRKSQEAGFDFHVVKPVDPAALEKLLTGSSATTCCKAAASGASASSSE